MFNDGVITVYTGGIGYNDEIEWDSIWEDYDEFIDYYDDYYEVNYGVTKPVFEATKKYLEDLIFNAEYYNDDDDTLMIQLHDNPTLQWVDNENLSDWDWEALVDSAIKEFKKQTGVDVYLAGRSGRHICVDFTLDNLENYDALVRKAVELEKQVIKQANNA
jgi:hypothetical protein